MRTIIRGRTRANTALRFAAVLAVLWSLLGVATTGPASAAPIADLAAKVAPPCPPPTADGQVIYGCNDLSRHLQDTRRWLNANKRGQTDKIFSSARRYTANYAIARLADGTHIIGYSDTNLHAEERLLRQMRGQEPRVVWNPQTRSVSFQPARAGQITAVYSELEPCSRKCNPALTNAGLRDKTTYSWKWNAPQGSPSAVVKDVQDRANNPKTGLKPIAIKQMFANGASGPIADPANVQRGTANAVQRQATARPLGGIDFSSIQLRYVSDGGTGGNTYAFRAPATPGEPSTDGAGAILDGFEALNVWMTLDPSKFWVNLNPGQPDRVIDPDLGATDVGHVLLQADLDLKRSGAKLIDPNTALGKRFWDRMDAAGLERFCTRNWIVPKPASVRESGSELYILDAPLEVKSESEDFQLPGNGEDTCPADSKPAVEIYRQVILPALTQVVNESPEYVDLRRVYISRVAAEWYKRRMIADGTAADFGVGSNDASIFESPVQWSPRTIFNQYVKEINATRYETPDGRVFITGGVDFTQPVPVTKVGDAAFRTEHPQLPTVVRESVQEVTHTTDRKNAFAGGADVVPQPTAPPTSRPTSPPLGGPANGGGELPVTGAPIMTITLVGVTLLLVGVFVVRRRRRMVFRLPED